MPFTVKDFRDLVRILEKHPEWQAELRRLILTEELLALPGLVRELADAQRQVVEQLLILGQQVRALAEIQQRTEERISALEEQVRALAEAQRRTEERVSTLEEQVRALAEAQRRTEEQVHALAEAQRRTEERVSALEEQVRALAEAQRRTEEQIRALAEAQQRAEEQIRALAEAQRHADERIKLLTDRMADVQGRVLEWRYREHAHAYFDDLLRRIHVLSTQELANLLDEPMARGALSRAERKEILMSDIVLRGRRWADDAEAFLIAEISVGIGEDDVERATRRAELLRRALERPVIAVVAGRGITPQASALARERGVWRILDGTPIAPHEE
ncbi:MAG: hypothetical protein N2443_06310 [Blastocatellia bacterium]|nr:hypothetical protein [Blastocatellia bacterium]MCX7752465.1 hypothetical protein [Blastocatellia bacterium]